MYGRSREAYCKRNTFVVCLLTLVFRNTLLSSLDIDRSTLNLYVSVSEGSDANDGSLLHPFKTIQRAKSQVRKVLVDSRVDQNNSVDKIAVNLRSGRYEILETLYFDQNDTASNKEVIYQAYCDPFVAQSTKVLFPYPYRDHPNYTELGILPKYEWNGVEILEENNTTHNEKDYVVCVDNLDGRACYNGSTGICVGGCMDACTHSKDGSAFSESFYKRFLYLFGRDLRKNEDCVQSCATSCQGCEKVIISGALRLNSYSSLEWEPEEADLNSLGYKMYKVDLSRVLDTVRLEQNAPPEHKIPSFSNFSALFVNGMAMPRAGYPNCLATKSKLKDCHYMRVTSQGAHKLLLNLSDAPSRLAQWSESLAKHNDVEIEVLPDVSISNASVLYRAKSVDADQKELTFDLGGNQLTKSRTGDMPFPRNCCEHCYFRIENLIEELDSPGEWYFDSSQQMLYLIPPRDLFPRDAAFDMSDPKNVAANVMTYLTIDIPMVQQLIRISTIYTSPSAYNVHEIDQARVQNIQLRHLKFSDSLALHPYYDLYEHYSIDSPELLISRIAAIFIENVSGIVIEHCEFTRLGGNAIIASGKNNDISIRYNNISQLGGSGICVFPNDGNQVLVSSVRKRSYTTSSEIAYNQIHDFGMHIAQSVGIGITDGLKIHHNLIYSLPAPASIDYAFYNAFRSSSLNHYEILRPMSIRTGSHATQSSDDDAFHEILTIHRQELSAQIRIVIELDAFNIPIIAKLVSAPDCLAGSGRKSACFQYASVCSGCCPLHDTSSQLRVIDDRDGLDHHQPFAQNALLYPGQKLELMVNSSTQFDTKSHVYLRFYAHMPNFIYNVGVSLDKAPPRPFLRWSIHTRSCRIKTHTYTTACAGVPACDPSATQSTIQQCGTSWIEISSPSKALSCTENYVADLSTYQCDGPFETQQPCDSHVIKTTPFYYNCSVLCTRTFCE